LEDFDSALSEFRVEMATFCGQISAGTVANPAFSALYTVHMGDMMSDHALDFQGPYGAIVEALKNISYIGRKGCNTLRQNEFLTLKVMNVENTSHNVTNIINIGLLSVNDPPQITTAGNPRWKISGLKLKSSRDHASTEFDTHQHDSGINNKNLPISSSSPIEVSNQQRVSSSSEITVFEGTYDTYMLAVQFTTTRVSLVSSSYVPISGEFVATLVSVAL
jgi:hypothetical protein